MVCRYVIGRRAGLQSHPGHAPPVRFLSLKSQRGGSMPTIRQQRVTELLFEELSIMIGNELNDPRLSQALVRVTNVSVSRDLRNVNVYVTHDDDDVSKREVLQGLRHATPF